MRNGNIPTPLESEAIRYQGKMIEVVTQRMLIGDKEVTFEWARRSPGTRLLITTINGTILLTREYRSELKGWDYRLPGGKVFDTLRDYNLYLQNGGDILQKAKEAAKKEAYEEVGINTNNLEYYYLSKCGATVEWDLYYFIVNVDTEITAIQRLEPGENIEIAWYTSKDAMDIVLSGTMNEDRSASVLFRYLHSHDTI